MGIRTPAIILTSLLTVGLAFAAPGQGASAAVKDAIATTEAGAERGKAVSEAARAHRGLGKDKLGRRAKAPAERGKSDEHVDGKRGKSDEHVDGEPGKSTDGSDRGKATAASKRANRAEHRAERKGKRAERKADGPRHPELPESADVPDAK